MGLRTGSARPLAEGKELGDRVPGGSRAGSRTRSEAQTAGGPGLTRACKARTHLRRRDAPPGAWPGDTHGQLPQQPAPRVARQRCAPAGFRRASRDVSTPPRGVANSAPPMPRPLRPLSEPQLCGVVAAPFTAVDIQSATLAALPASPTYRYRWEQFSFCFGARSDVTPQLHTWPRSKATATVLAPQPAPSHPAWPWFLALLLNAFSRRQP